MSSSVGLSIYVSYGNPQIYSSLVHAGQSHLFGSPTSYNFTVTINSINGTPDLNQRLDIYNHNLGVLLGSIPLTVGASFSSSASNSSIRVENVVSAPDCDDDSDCEKGEKCVDGECVPCEKLVDGKGLVTLWGVPRVSDGTIMSDGLPVDISSGVS